MKQYENDTRIVRPNYTLPALVLVSLGYYISFYIADKPHTQNALALKALGITCMLVFGTTIVLGALKALKK